MTPRPASAARRATLLGAAAAAALAALPVAAQAQTTTEFKLAAPKKDTSLSQLELSARCSTACTVRVDRISVQATRRGGLLVGDPLYGAADEPVNVTKRVPANKPTTIRFAVPTPVQIVTASNVTRGNVAYLSATISVTPNGGERFEAIRQASVREPNVPAKPNPYIDDIVLREGTPPRDPKRLRYRVSVRGKQGLAWRYDRNRTTGSCSIIDNGEGVELLDFRTTRSAVITLQRGPGGAPVLVDFPKALGVARVGVRIDANRGGRKNASSSGCTGGGGGGGGGGGEPPACTQKGSKDAHVYLAYNRRGRLQVVADPSSLEPVPGQKPDCPVELPTPHEFYLVGDNDIRNSDPRGAKGRGMPNAPGTFIIKHRVVISKEIEGGAIAVETDWTITFRRLN